MRAWGKTRHALLLLASSAILSVVGIADARQNTWCVGGYDGEAPFSNNACARPEIADKHRHWHFHAYLSDGKKCYACYDEVDDSCESDFLDKHPGWYMADAYECLRKGLHDGIDQVYGHVIDGQTVAAPPPPPAPPPSVLTPALDRVSPGPYTAGDKVEVVGVIRDDKGNIRPISGGTFIIDDGKGNKTTVSGSAKADGTVVAEIPLPASENTKIEFRPNPPSLLAGEKLGASNSAPIQLKVEVCAYRARVIAPATGEALASGQVVSFKAALFDSAGKVPVPTPPDTSLVFTLQITGEKPQILQASTNLETSFTPPASPKPRSVNLSAGGKAGDRAICPAEGVDLILSDLGLGFDDHELPDVCYVGMKCTGQVRLLRPTPGAARHKVDAILSDPATELVLLDKGKELWKGKPNATDRYTFDRDYGGIGVASFWVEVRGPSGVIAMKPHETRIRPPLKLVLPKEIDFGTINASSDWSTNCQKLDFSQSQAAEEHGWNLLLEGDGSCVAQPVLAYTGPTGRPAKRDLRPEIAIDALDPKDRSLYLCLVAPRCSGETSPKEVALKVTPRTPIFASQATQVHLKWVVKGRPWYSCHAFWMVPTGLGLTLLFFILGFLRPARFPAGASIKVAGSEKGLKNASALVLVECPGSNAGFYRDASLGLHSDGSVTGQSRHALLVLRAVRGGILILAKSGMETQDRRTRKWVPVEDLKGGHLPSSNTVYRVSDTYFRLEIG